MKRLRLSVSVVFAVAFTYLQIVVVPSTESLAYKLSCPTSGIKIAQSIVLRDSLGCGNCMTKRCPGSLNATCHTFRQTVATGTQIFQDTLLLQTHSTRRQTVAFLFSQPLHLKKRAPTFSCLTSAQPCMLVYTVARFHKGVS